MRHIKSAILAVLFVAMTAGSVFARTHDFVLVNRTGRDIYSVYPSPSKSNSWEEDILGRDVMKNGDKITIRFDAGRAKYWDIKVVYSSGRFSSWHHIDLIRAKKFIMTRKEITPIRR